MSQCRHRRFDEPDEPVNEGSFLLKDCKNLKKVNKKQGQKDASKVLKAIKKTPIVEEKKKSESESKQVESTMVLDK
jgi:hypothetical protein